MIAHVAHRPAVATAHLCPAVPSLPLQAAIKSFLKTALSLMAAQEVKDVETCVAGELPKAILVSPGGLYWFIACDGAGGEGCGDVCGGRAKQLLNLPFHGISARM